MVKLSEEAPPVDLCFISHMFLNFGSMSVFYIHNWLNIQSFILIKD